MSPRDLERHYQATTYEVTIAGETIGLRIGKHSSRLDVALVAAKVREWVFITAWNPDSQERPGDENARKQSELEALLSARGKTAHPGWGIPDDRTTWKPEQSVLAWPIGREEALELGRRFGQKAVLWGQRGQAPELLFVDLETNPDASAC